MFYLIGGLIHLFLSMFMLTLTIQLVVFALSMVGYLYLVFFGVDEETPAYNSTDKNEEEMI